MRDRIAAVAEGLARFSVRRSEAKRARDFQDRAEALRKPSEQLEGLCRKYRLLSSHGVALALGTDTPRSLLGQVRELRQRFEAEPESILAGDPKKAATFWRPLHGYADQVQSDLQHAWADWVDDALPGGEKDLLTVLDKFASFHEPVQVIRKGQMAAAQLAAQLPASEEPFTSVASVADAMAKAWDRLNGAHISLEVLTFLRKAAAREATLADVTPNVIKWVQENDLFRSFLVTVGGK